MITTFAIKMSSSATTIFFDLNITFVSPKSLFKINN